MISNSKPDILFITETWLRDNKDDRIWLDSTCLNQSPYQAQQISRKTRKRGRILLLSSINFNCKLLRKCSSPTFEGATWKLEIGNISLYVTGVYHPPPSAKNNTTNIMFIDQLSDYLMDLLSHTSNHIVLGDFNIHVNDPNNVDAGILLDTLSALGLEQHVQISTHNRGNTLDLIFTEDIGSARMEGIGSGGFLSDHKLILCQLSLSKPHLKPIKKRVRKLNDIAIQKFADVYDANILSDEYDTNTIAIKLESELSRVLDVIAPIKEKKVHPRPLQPWFNETLRMQKKLVRNRERVWLKYQMDSTWNAYKRERNRYNFMLKYAKTQHLQELIIDSRGDTKRLYKIVNKPIGKRDDNPLPKSCDDRELAEEFADFFLDKIDKIRSKFKELPMPTLNDRKYSKTRQVRPFNIETSKKHN